MAATTTELTAGERAVVLRALKHPRGRYDADPAVVPGCVYVIGRVAAAVGET